jgi:hypothetical protein
MEMSQGNQCIAILNKQTFFFLQKWKIRGLNRTCLGISTSERWEDMGRGCGRVNMVQILCTHVCKWKNETC